MYFMMFYDVICLRNAYKCVEKESKLQSEVNILVCFTRLYDVNIETDALFFTTMPTKTGKCAENSKFTEIIPIF